MPDINGIPYVESSDLVSAYPAASQALAQEVSDQLASKLDATAPVGKVLQVVQAVHSTITSSSSSTYADTGLTATITPSSATSKVFVMVTHGSVAKSGNTSVQIKLFRGATDLGVFDGTAAYNAATDQQHVGGVAFNYLDSPATTSATTYKTQFASGANIATAWINNSGKSTITLLEVSA